MMYSSWRQGACLEQPRSIAWQDILTESPSVAGVYSWYYTPHFADYDLRQLEEELIRRPDPEVVEQFLQRHLFAYVREVPY